MPRVSSPQNPRFKETARLVESSRERRKTGRCVLEGEHLITVYCDRIGPPETLVVVEDALDDPRIATLVQRIPPSDVLVVPRRMFSNIAALAADIGVLAAVRAPAHTLPAPDRFCLLLENIQDPGNVGTMLRTAAAAGVTQVLLSKGCAFAWSPKALRAGQGAHFLTTVVEDVDLCAWSAAFRTGGGHVVALVAHGGRNLYDSDIDWPAALAVGNEGGGPSGALCAQADIEVTIPMPGGMESLNAAAAAAVALFEWVRRSAARDSQ